MEHRIVLDPAIRHGKPVIRGTRVPVEIVVGSLAGGMSIEEVMEEYGVSREDVLATLQYATQVIANTELEPLAMS